MKIRLLGPGDKLALKNLFTTSKYMGVSGEAEYFVGPTVDFLDTYYNGFCQTYLSGLKSYHAFGGFDDNGNITAIIAFYESFYAPEWYWTQVRSNNSNIIPAVLDAVIDYNEKNGRFKFFGLFNLKHANLYPRLAYSKSNAERYGSIDEFIVLAKQKCIYTTPWNVLYNRTLIPVDTLVRCRYLKQEYRNSIPNGGNL